MSDAERDYAIRSSISSLALSGIEVPRELAERIYDAMEVYALATEAYDAALRAFYPPPVIITTDRTEAP